MDNNLGMGGTPFEYVVSAQKGATVKIKRLLLILFYVAFTVGAIVGITLTRLGAPFIALVPLALFAIIIPTWRRTKIEYEYSFLSGVMTISKIIGGRSRREVVCIRLSDLDAIVEDTAEGREKLQRFNPEVMTDIPAASTGTYPYIAMWMDEGGKRRALTVQLVDNSIKIVKTYNRSAYSGQ